PLQVFDELADRRVEGWIAIPGASEVLEELARHDSVLVSAQDILNVMGEPSEARSSARRLRGERFGGQFRGVADPFGALPNLVVLRFGRIQAQGTARLLQTFPEAAHHLW